MSPEVKKELPKTKEPAAADSFIISFTRLPYFYFTFTYMLKLALGYFTFTFKLKLALGFFLAGSFPSR